MVRQDAAAAQRLAFWGIPIALAVLGLKMIAWWVTGSVALLSDGLESIVNVVAAIVAFVVIGYAAKPADASHPFGHHKAEYFSAVIEGVLIIVAALLIVAEAIPAVLSPRLPDAPVLGLAINLGAGIINAIWAFVLLRAGSAYRSPALSADGHHIMSDVITSAGVLVGLVLAIVSGYAVLDPLLAAVVACNILYQGWKVIAGSVDGLMDRAVSQGEEAAIKQVIATNASGSLGVHDLKTRQAGPAIFVEFHMVVPAAMPVGDAHDICDRLEDSIRAVNHGAKVTIHVEPEGEIAHGIRVKVVEGMKKMTKTDVSGLSQLGQTVAAPENPEDAVLERVPNGNAGTDFVVRFTAPEFTSLCPMTGQPDFAHIVIDYLPGDWLVESKSLKLFLHSFRNHGAFHEDCSIYIARRIVELLDPKWLRIGAYWYPRGGIPIDVFWQTGAPPEGLWLPDQGVPTYRGRG